MVRAEKRASIPRMACEIICAFDAALCYVFRSFRTWTTGTSSGQRESLNGEDSLNVLHAS